MKSLDYFRFGFLPAFCLSALLAAAAQAGERISAPAKEAVTPEEQHAEINTEVEFTDAYVGGARVERQRDDRFDENDSFLHILVSPRTAIGYLRLGVDWQRFSFGLQNNSPLPNTLQSVSLILGLDTKLSDSILIRIEAQPGIYGTFFDDLNSGDFNVPFVIGGTYVVSPDFQIVLGVGVDVNRKYPVLPGGGIRWKLAPQWVLNAVAPTPRLEYQYSDSTTVYAGAEFKDGTYRVDSTFGDAHGDARLNRAIVTYTEIRAGVGLIQKFGSHLTLNAEVGCQPYREFDFYRADARYHSDGIAPYGKLSLQAAF